MRRVYFPLVSASAAAVMLIVLALLPMLAVLESSKLVGLAVVLRGAARGGRPPLLVVVMFARRELEREGIPVEDPRFAGGGVVRCSVGLPLSTGERRESASASSMRTG